MADNFILIIFGIIISIIILAVILFILYVIIKTAVRNGINESKLSQMLISQQNSKAAGDQEQ